MKSARKTTGPRHEQRPGANRDDSYRDTRKEADPVACPRCHASYRAGRWTWRPAAPGAARHPCPACQRLEDNFPAGQVTLRGPFFAAHREEVLALVSARAKRALEEHPLQRIIGMKPDGDAVLVTTTDPHLARGIAVALQAAYKGSLDLAFSRDEHFVRATWTR